MKKINRRSFIKKSAAMSGGFYFFSGNPLNSLFEPKYNPIIKESVSRIVYSTNNEVRNGKFSYDGDILFKMLNNSIEELYEIEKTDNAWRRVVSPEDIVGLKINCLAGKRMSTNIDIVEAVIECLLSSGVKKGNIIVWDRFNSDLERAGYKIRNKTSEVKYIGNDMAGYDKNITSWGEAGSLVSKIASEYCTAIINIPVLKDHGIAGMTCALKNYFGAIHNPHKYHVNKGDPFIADVNMYPQLKNKTKLVICDALLAQYEGGPPFKPQWTWEENSILISEDMVALDRTGLDILEKKRKDLNRPSFKADGREPVYIATAADKNHNLGTDDPEKINLIKV